ncbi:MAG: cytochrome c-type biogenesis protein CcmH [Chloroflexota bacterium]
MRRWIGPLAVAGVLALVGVVALLPAPRAPDPAATLAGELRCPDCQALSVAESRTAASIAIRREIAAQLAAGRSVDEARQHFVDRYGAWILLRPAAPLAWLVPLVAVVVALAGLAAWLLLHRRPRARPVTPPVDATTRQRLADETEALDA